MRLDIPMYVIAAIFLALALISFIFFPETNQLWIILNIILSITSTILGYGLKPKPKPTIKKLSTATTSTHTEKTITQPTPAEETPIIEETTVNNAPAEEPPVAEEPIIETTTATEETTDEEIAEETTDEEIAEETTDEEIETSTTPLEETSSATTTQSDEVTTEIEQAEEISLTNVKGIGEKRAAQLNALGINTAKDLAQASAEDLAEKLKISPKVVAKLIEAAKQQ